MYEQITEDRLIELQFSTEYQSGTTSEKENMITNILTYAFSQSIQKRQASTRGNTFPDKIIRLIKVKRKLQKHLKKISSEKRKRLERLIAECTDTEIPMAQYDWTNETLEQEELLHRVYRKDINKYDKDIKSEIEEHRTRSWNKGLEKLADLGMDNARKNSGPKYSLWQD